MSSALEPSGAQEVKLSSFKSLDRVDIAILAAARGCTTIRSILRRVRRSAPAVYKRLSKLESMGLVKRLGDGRICSPERILIRFSNSDSPPTRATGIEKLDSTDIKILRAIAGRCLTAREIVLRTGLSRGTVYNHLLSLRMQGIVDTEGDLYCGPAAIIIELIEIPYKGGRPWSDYSYPW